MYKANGENIYRMPEGQDENVDKLRGYTDFTTREIETIPIKPEQPTDPQSILDYENTVRDLIRDVFNTKLKIDPKLLGKMETAMLSRLYERPDDKPLPYIAGHRVKRSLHRIKEVVDNVAMSDIQRLHDEFGVVNLDMYKHEDLYTLISLLDQDTDAINYLRNGDVTVVFTDAYGDYNGALAPTFDSYRKESGRSLMFEVAQPGDFYRRMITLKRLGIKPSTVVIAAHGSPAKTSFGRGDSGFALTTNKYVSDDYDLPSSINIDETQLERLASDEFMQGSRGIDDPTNRTGRRTFILNSCSSDVAFKNLLPSSIETVVRTIGRTDVDGYGASSDLYLGTENGKVIFNGLKEKRNNKHVFKPNGTRVSLNERPSLKDKAVTKLTKRENGMGVNLTEQLKNGQLLIKRTAVSSINLTNPNKRKGRAA